MNNTNWTKYTIEFLSIFVAVISASALNNWNDNRRNHVAETKILTEIIHGLEKDIDDVDMNVYGHEQGIKANAYWRSIFLGNQPNTDTLFQYYFQLTRDFVSIQNTSGYETLKSKGFEIIQNDSLRAMIIGLYEYNYQTLLKLEEEYQELQFHKSFYHEINQYIAPNLEFDEQGKLIGLDLPVQLTKTEKNTVLSYLWKIDVNRKFILHYYTEVKQQIEELKTAIQKELDE